MDSQQLLAEHNYTATSSTVAKRRSPATPAAFPTHIRQSSKERQEGSESDDFTDLVEGKKRHMADRGHNPSTITKKRSRIESSDSSQGADQPGSPKVRSGGNKYDVGHYSADENESNPNEPRYCICNQVSYGEMIACDNKDCSFEWFHYACVRITQPPKGKWYCPQCTCPNKPTVASKRGTVSQSRKHSCEAKVVKVKHVGEAQVSKSSGTEKLKTHSSPGQWPNGYGSNSSQSTDVSLPAYDSHSDPEWRSPKKKGKRKFVKQLSGLSSSSSGQMSPVKKQQKKHRCSGKQQAVQQPVVHPHPEFGSANETGDDRSDQPGHSHRVDSHPVEETEGDQLVPADESADGDGAAPEADQLGEVRFKPWRVDFGSKKEKGKLFKAYQLQVMDDFNKGPISDADRARRAAELAELAPSHFHQTRGCWAKKFITLEKCKAVYRALLDKISFTTIMSDIMQPMTVNNKDESSTLIRQMDKYIRSDVHGREEELPPPICFRLMTYKEKGPELSEKQLAHLDGVQIMKLEDKLSTQVIEFLRLQEVKDQLPAKRTDVGEMLGLTAVVVNSAHTKLLEEVERIRENDDEKKTVERSRRLGDGLDLTDTNCKLFLRRVHMEIERIQLTAEKPFLALWPNSTVSNSKKAPKWPGMGNVGPIDSLATYNWDGTPDDVKEEMLKALELDFSDAKDGSPRVLTIRRNIYNSIKPAVLPTAFKILKRFLQCLQKAEECDFCNFEVNMKAWLKHYDANTLTKVSRNRDLLPYRRIRCSSLQAYHKLLTLLAKAVGLLPLKYKTDPFNEELGDDYRKGIPQEVFNPRCHFTIAEVDYCCRELIKQRITSGVGVSPADIQMMLLWQMFVLLGKRPQSFVPHPAGMGDYQGLLVGDLGFSLIQETIVVEMRIRHEKQIRFLGDLEPINRRSRRNEYDMVNLLILHLLNLNAIDQTTMDLSKGHIQLKDSALCQNLFVQADYHSGLLLTEKPMTLGCMDSIMEKLADIAHLPVNMVSPKCFRISFYQELEVGLMRTKGWSKAQARQFIAELNGVRPNSMAHYDKKAMLKEADVTYYMMGASGQLSPLGEDDRIVKSDVTLMRADESVYYWHGDDTAVIKYAESMVQTAGWDKTDEPIRFLRLCKAIADELNKQTLLERRDAISRTGSIPTSLNPKYAGASRVLRVTDMSREMNKLAEDVRLVRFATCPYPDCTAELTYGWAGHLKEFHQIDGTDTNIKCPLCGSKSANLGNYIIHLKRHVGVLQTQMICSGCHQRVGGKSKQFHKCPSVDKDTNFYPYQWCPWLTDEVVGKEVEIPITCNEVIQSYNSVEDDNEDC